MLEATRIETFPWRSMEWLADGVEKEVSPARMVVAPGRLSPAHRRGDCNEIVHVVCGACVQRRGDRAYEETAA